VGLAPTGKRRLYTAHTQHGQSISDLPRILHAAGVIAAPSRPKGDKLYERIWRFFCHLNVDNEPTRLEARKKLDALLKKHNLEWNGANGFTAILVVYWADNNNISAAATTSHTSSSDAELNFNALDFVLALLEDYHVMSPEHRLVTALWVIHTHVYDEFEFTPGLIPISPASGYGKTKLLQMLKLIVSEPHLTKNTTAPAMYRQLERKPHTSYLIDEGENQGVLTDRVMRALLDAASEGGSIDRADGEFPVHFPWAVALRGQVHDLPLSILSRAHVLPMVKGVPNKRFDRKNPGPDFPFARELIEKWRATVSLNPDPEMPDALLKDGRVADKCRPLIAIADNFGEEYGKAARAALVELNKHLPHQNPAIAALIACKTVFDARDVDRVERKALTKAVVEEDDYFSDWRGPNDQVMPHELTPGELSRMLKGLGVRARSMRLGRDRDGRDKWGWCYTRAQIESAWRAHCSENHDTATQSSNVIALAKI
jgi:hypothetical protein